MLGISLAAGQGVGVALLLAIFVSNLPEAMGSADEMRKAGRSRAAILRLWVVVAAICTLATSSATPPPTRSPATCAQRSTASPTERLYW